MITSKTLRGGVSSLVLLTLLNFHSTTAQTPPPSTNTTSYTWTVTLGNGAPDCFERPVLLVNGQFQPTIEVTQGDTLEVTVINEIPETYPDVGDGIAIHWHGFHMNDRQWYDGTAYVAQCPIPRGGSFTYKFVVDELPGTYMWHAHGGAQLADGLAGPLIVTPRAGGPSVIPPYDGEHVMFIQDWYHTQAGLLTQRLNRPFDLAKATPETGGFAWVNNPQAILFNGKGMYQACNLNAAGVTTVNVTCNVTTPWIAPGASAIQPYATVFNPGCALTNYTVEAGKTYLFRIINAASLVYQTICFENHTLTVVAADAVPITPFTTTCLDVNSGQRYDVLLTADKGSDFGAGGSYWVSSQVQYRAGSPSGFAVLKYGEGAPALPGSVPPQPGSVAPWTMADINKITGNAEALKEAAAIEPLYSPAAAPVPEATVRILINMSQPLLEQTGQIRWALNNVAYLKTPPCEPLQVELHKDGNAWVNEHTITSLQYNSANTTFQSESLGIQEASQDTGIDIFVTDPRAVQPMPLKPVAGLHLVPVNTGDVVEVVLQNNPANSFNGDYTGNVNRTAMEQHPFHLHGHHFWMLGLGTGAYPGAESAAGGLNTVNPPLRDTATILPNSYVVLRFVADNPGTWLLHCHIFYHQYMGQMLSFVYGMDQVASPPDGMPSCPEECTANAAPWTPATTAASLVPTSPGAESGASNWGNLVAVSSLSVLIGLVNIILGFV